MMNMEKLSDSYCCMRIDYEDIKYHGEYKGYEFTDDQSRYIAGWLSGQWESDYDFDTFVDDGIEYFMEIINDTSRNDYEDFKSLGEVKRIEQTD